MSGPERECRQTAQRQDAQRQQYLRGAADSSALGATHSKGTALQARYHRVKRHRGHKKAVVAVGHQILEIAYFIMRDGVTYQELGADYFRRRDARTATVAMSVNSKPSAIASRLRKPHDREHGVSGADSRQNHHGVSHERGSPRSMKILVLLVGGSATSSVFGTRESARSLTREREAPRIVAVEHAEQIL